ncbi:hypothetical protein ACH5RR_003015 [Cinchona calisaya]|uniref:Methyltransferase type 11 domain-containing protein n=1 Tax=Cinchona calisaya TaxID=153742 RepID=A0ABD3ATL6_9GENT
MSELLFNKQAKQYSASRPTYPGELFQFIVSKTPCYDLAWDVGTGSGQAARSLAGVYRNVVATDTSPKQLEFAVKLPNIRYHLTTPNMSLAEVDQNISAESTVDLVTSASAMQCEPQAKFVVHDKYRTIEFPFQPVDGLEHTGPFEFKMERLMDLDGFFTFIKSWSPYQTAKDKGIELLNEDVVQEFTRAWNEDGNPKKIATFPIYLRIGKVGNK